MAMHPEAAALAEEILKVHPEVKPIIDQFAAESDYDETEDIFPGWGIVDMRFACRQQEKDISDEDATKLLEYCQEKIDRSIGTDWDTIWLHAEDLAASGGIKLIDFDGEADIDDCHTFSGDESDDDEEEEIVSGWKVRDIRYACRQVGKDLSDDHAIAVLHEVAENFDANIGVNWNRILYHVDSLESREEITLIEFAGKAVLDECDTFSGEATES